MIADKNRTGLIKFENLINLRSQFTTSGSKTSFGVPSLQDEKEIKAQLSTHFDFEVIEPI